MIRARRHLLDHITVGGGVKPARNKAWRRPRHALHAAEMATRRMMKRSALVMGMMAAGGVMASAWILPSKRVMVAGRGGRIVYERRLPW